MVGAGFSTPAVTSISPNGLFHDLRKWSWLSAPAGLTQSEIVNGELLYESGRNLRGERDYSSWGLSCCCHPAK